jgi:formamidopyrimidine-DNA glycosylase
MPELPEVHTTVAGIRDRVVGKKILDAWSDFHLNTAYAHRKNLKNRSYFNGFKKRVLNAKIIGVERMGKNIILNLSNKESVVVHMKMTGHLMVENYEKENKFIHFILSLSDKTKLVLSDMRKFASVTIAKTAELREHPGIAELGPDALEVSAPEFVGRIISKRKWPIKLTLLDQSLFAGIGNIYSDEILWAAGVHPLSASIAIPKNILTKMHGHSIKILKKSIELGGDSMSDYLNAFGEKGGFQKLHKAYRQTGKKCAKPGCRGIIERIVVGGRSSHYCSLHQKRY